MATTTLPVVVASSDPENRRALTTILQSEGWDPLWASRIQDCVEILRSRPSAIVLCDERLRDGTYRDLLDNCKTVSNEARILVLARHPDWPEYLDVLRSGGFDLLAWPSSSTNVIWALLQAERIQKERIQKRTACAGKA